MYSIVKNGDNIKTNLEASVQSNGNISCVRYHKLIFEKEEKGLVCMAGRWGTENVISQWVLW
jgi:hypothetical protein